SPLPAERSAGWARKRLVNSWGPSQGRRRPKACWSFNRLIGCLKHAEPTWIKLAFNAANEIVTADADHRTFVSFYLKAIWREFYAVGFNRDQNPLRGGPVVAVICAHLTRFNLDRLLAVFAHF